jgi:ABC-type transport system involved in Fe-S cluster assembly fused permease/ATPase subunit
MNDRLLPFVVYGSTPTMLVLGLVVMYLIIGDHEWFAYMAGGYVLLLVILFLVKLSIYRFLVSHRDAALARKSANASAGATETPPSSGTRE